MSKSIAQIKAEFEQADGNRRAELYDMYGDDARSGVQKLIASYRKKEEALRLERSAFLACKVMRENTKMQK